MGRKDTGLLVNVDAARRNMDWKVEVARKRLGRAKAELRTLVQKLKPSVSPMQQALSKAGINAPLEPAFVPAAVGRLEVDILSAQKCLDLAIKGREAMEESLVNV
jgi:hypothetical protein